MQNINITTEELKETLDMTPASQNVMLVGKHGIGKSEILTAYFKAKGMRVVPLFLGQMADPGDLIGLPNKNSASGKTEFMPPYWFPTDDKPIVLFLDELNRARPEVLQTIMDLALNRKLAGRSLPEGSRLISAVNDGEEYQLTDLDPALVSRFNIYTFKPTVQEWLVWAAKNKVDNRVVNFISENNDWLDGVGGLSTQMDLGLEKTPDRRAWTKVSDVIKEREVDSFVTRVIAGVVGAKAAQEFYAFIRNNSLVNGKDVISDFKKCEQTLKRYQLHELTAVNDSIMRTLEVSTPTQRKNAPVNLQLYVDFLIANNKEAMGHFTNLMTDKLYKKAVAFISAEIPTLYNKVMDFINKI